MGAAVKRSEAGGRFIKYGTMAISLLKSEATTVYDGRILRGGRQVFSYL